MTPQFSIVLPTCGRPDLLTRCLDRLVNGAQELSADRYEVIVSDDAADQTLAQDIKRRYPEVQIVEGPRRGPAANRNRGAQLARGEWLVFVDDDCIPDPEWLNEFATAILREPNSRVFEGRVYPDGPQPSLAHVCPANETGGYLWSCNFAIERDLFRSLGGFDEHFRFAAMEDVDLRYRLRQRNVPFHFVPGAAVCHPWRVRGGWTALTRQRDSILVYLALHPEERATITPRSFFFTATRGLVRQTLPRVLSGDLRGLGSALQEHLFFVGIALRLLLPPPSLK